MDCELLHEVNFGRCFCFNQRDDKHGVGNITTHFSILSSPVLKKIAVIKKKTRRGLCHDVLIKDIVYKAEYCYNRISIKTLSKRIPLFFYFMLCINKERKTFKHSIQCANMNNFKSPYVNTLSAQNLNKR